MIRAIRKSLWPAYQQCHDWKTSIRNKLNALKLAKQNRDQADQIVIHAKWVKQAPHTSTVRLLTPRIQFGPTRTHGLLMLLCHNRMKHTVLELSLRKVGITDYGVARVDPQVPWRHSRKIVEILKYLKTMERMPAYTFYLDSDDCVIRDNPLKAIELLTEYNCEILFSATTFSRQYACNPEVKAWADNIATEAGWPGWYLNAGVFIGKTSSLLK